MGRLEYDFKSLAQDVQNMQSVTLTDWESKADLQLSCLCKNLNDASFKNGQHLTQSLKLIEEADKREKNASKLSLIAAFSTPWIIYGILSISLGCA
jgi:predicted transcriptional regulator